MNDDSALLLRLEQKAEYHAREAERYRVAAEVLRAETVGRRGPRGGRDADGSAQDPRASTIAMVEVALNEAGRPLDPKALLDEMKRLGWETDAANPLNTARTAAHRLVQRGRIQRLADGAYARLGLPHQDGQPDGGDPGKEPPHPAAPGPWADAEAPF